MRSDADLDYLIAGAIKTSGGAMPLEIAAYSQAEAERLEARLRGKRGARTLSVRLLDPSEATSIMDRIRGPWRNP